MPCRPCDEEQVDPVQDPAARNDGASHVHPQRDIVLITFRSVWTLMLLNSFRAIYAVWGFQLNGYVTGEMCSKNIDLVEFCPNSIPKRNNVLCLGVIRKGTESETIYQITWGDFRTAAVLMCSYEHCGKPGCDCYDTVMERLTLLRNTRTSNTFLAARIR